MTAAASAAAVTQAARAAVAKNHMVEIRGFKFVPDTLAVAPGDTITWTNRDLAPHTATSVDEGWDTGEIGQDESVMLDVTDDMAGTRCENTAFRPVSSSPSRRLTGPSP